MTAPGRRAHVYDSFAPAKVMPDLVRLGPNLVGAAFFLMKLLPAHFILSRAEKEGRIQPGSVIIETSSGTFGLALAMLAAQKQYRLVLVSDNAIDAALRMRMEDLGAELSIVTAPAPVGGIQRARLDRMQELQDRHPGHFWPSQYHNPENGGAYSRLAEHVLEAMREVDFLVGTVGSGGSMCGTARYLRQVNPRMQLVGVDTHRSILFGHEDGARPLRGLGNSLLPGNLDHTAFDEVHWVTAAEAFRATRELHRRSSLYMGGTSGAAYMVARWVAEKNPGAKVLVLLPDEGHRYAHTIYDDAWLRQNDLWLDRSPEEPLFVKHPRACEPRWSAMRWGRRNLDDALRLGAPPSIRPVWRTA